MSMIKKDKVETILNVPRPVNVSHVKAFLDLVTYYFKFVPTINYNYTFLKKECEIYIVCFLITRI